MATKTIKFKELQKIDVIYGQFLNDPVLSKTKMSYALKRFIESNIKFFKEYNTGLQDLRIDNALVDEKTKELLTDEKNPRGFKYGKEELKKLLKEENDWMDKFKEKDCDVEVYICKDTAGADLSEEDIEILKGYVI